MVRYLLPHSSFPDPVEADQNGLVAVGGQLTTKTLLAAYEKGIFPWFNYPPILWYSLSPRMILVPDELYVGRTLRSTIKKKKFHITLDTCFRKVIKECAKKKRPGQYGTWINKDIITAYSQLHDKGYAHSCEAWLDGKLVGGLYGISLGRAFYGESMFARRTDASKIALAALCGFLAGHGVTMIDCQQETEHLASLGARPIPRSEFVAHLRTATAQPPIVPWRFDKTVLEWWTRARDAER